MKRTFLVTAAVLVTMALPAPTRAVEAHHQPAATSTEAGTQLSDGEVRKVDKDAKKITIKHGPIQNLEMPSMTMVFQVKDAAMLDQVKPGDRVRFVAEKVGGQYTVTRLDPVK